MQKYKSNNSELFKYLSIEQPYAVANIVGGADYPTISGTAEFYAFQNGVLVVVDVSNLPKTETNIFALHIHDGTTCDNNFAETGTHYNPTNEQHPNHKGDLPPLFSNNGRAWLAFFDQRFNINEVIEKVVIIHDRRDDFTTQPSGDSGNKIACGIIEKL